MMSPAVRAEMYNPQMYNPQMYNPRPAAMLLYSLLAVCLGPTLAQVGLYKCPAPWVDFRDKCMKFELVQATREKAIEQCDNDGATLVSINSRQEHSFIAEWLETNSPVSLTWYTSGYKEQTAANNEEDRDVVFYWGGDNTEVLGAQFWLTPGDRNKETGQWVVYTFDGVKWGWVLGVNASAERSYICEINKTETYKILESERGFDFGRPVLDPSLLDRGPVFIRDPEDVIYEDNKNNPRRWVEFQCEADAQPFPAYTWYRRRQQQTVELDPLAEDKLTITSGRLVIHSPTDTADNGDYWCLAENKYGRILSKRATLRFGYLTHFPDTAREAVEVDSYKGIGIDCDPPKHGYNSLSYSWYKDSSKNFIHSDRKPHIFISRDGKLYFSTATKDDVGYYTCLVAAPGIPGGKHSMPIRLTVRESSGNVYEPEMVNGFPKVFPSSPMRGDDVFLECVALGSLPLDYYWTRKGGANIPVQARLLDNNRVLKIPSAQIENGGTYMCSVTRRNGQSKNQTVTLEIRAKPYFPIPLSSQHIDTGSDLSWRCYGKGIPEVAYEWYRDGAPVQLEAMVPRDADRFSINHNVLTIRGVTARDEGMYQCRISNSLGTAFSSAQLRTVEFAPTFEKYPLPPNQYATLGGRTTVICHPEAAPPSDKFWFKDGRALNPGPDDGSRVSQLRNGNLHISRVQESDRGTYACRAVNSRGEAESQGNLTILSSTDISFTPTNNQGIRVNSTAFLHCDATYNPALDLTYDWWHNNYHIEFERLRVGAGNIAYFELDKHFKRGEGINRGGLFIEDVQQWHAGDYYCVTKTSSDEVRSKSIIQVVGPPSPTAGVTAENAEARSITVTWWPGASNGATTQYYIVEGYNTLEAVWRRLKSNIRGHTDLDRQVTTRVTDLSPGSQYYFRVRAVNENGEGEPSDKSAQMYKTADAPPTTTPRGLGGGGGKVGTLVMWWDPLPPAEYNGEGLRYRLSWKDQEINDDDKWSTTIVSGVKSSRFVTTVGRQNFYKLYDIKIQAINDAGSGNYSETVTIRSAEEMPVAVPKDVKAVYHNSTAINVHFTSVPNTREAVRGVLGGYRINYWNRDTEDETMAQFRIIEGQTDSGVIIGLTPNTFYTVNVQVFNTAGLTATSEDYTTRTLRYAPLEAPQEVHIRIRGPHEVEVDWRGVSTTIEEEPLEGYAVRLFRRGENIYVAKDYDAGKVARKAVSGLETGVMYELRVYGYSRGGVGLQSSPTMEFILGEKCYIKEDSPDKEYIYTCGGHGLRPTVLVTLGVALWHALHGRL